MPSRIGVSRAWKSYTRTCESPLKATPLFSCSSVEALGPVFPERKPPVFATRPYRSAEEALVLHFVAVAAAAELLSGCADLYGWHDGGGCGRM